MTTNLLVLFLLILLCSPVCFAQTTSDKTDAKLSSMPVFELSPEARAAGIDGKLVINLTVGTDGKASGIRVFGTPMWPCGKEVKDALIEDVRDAVKQHLLLAKFEPAAKNGKPRSSDVQITFLLTETFRRANDVKAIQEGLKRGVIPELVEVKDIDRLAISLPKQIIASGNPPSYRLTEMQVMVDESGNVISSGGLRAGQRELREARKLLCAAKFKPLVISQTATKMTGVVMYGLY